MNDNFHIWRFLLHASDAHSARNGYWYENQDRDPRHICCMQFTMAGSVHVRNGDQHYIVPKGGAFLHFNGEDSAYGLSDQTDNEYEAEWVNFSGAGLVEHWKLMNQEFGPVIDPEIGSLVLKATHRMCDNIQNQSDTAYYNASSEVYRFISELYAIREQGRDLLRKPVDRAIHRIMQNPCYPWSIKSLV
ncbi:MAG: hypothetical protein HRU15_04255, partial [Planctomycetes bacterium]|nr:hypothetical protein [Planctomycetota bacterium]